MKTLMKKRLKSKYYFRIKSSYYEASESSDDLGMIGGQKFCDESKLSSNVNQFSSLYSALEQQISPEATANLFVLV